MPCTCYSRAEHNIDIAALSEDRIEYYGQLEEVGHGNGGRRWFVERLVLALQLDLISLRSWRSLLFL